MQLSRPVRIVLVTLGSIALLLFSIGAIAYGTARWERPTLLKIGFSPDWEYGSRKRLQHKLTNQAPAELGKVVSYMNDTFKPDIVVGGGDYVESSAVKPEKALVQLKEVNDIFKGLHAPRLYAFGNHDMRSLTKEEVKSVLEVPETHAVRDIGDWRLIVLDTNFNKEDDTNRSRASYTIGYVSRAELDWLDQSLNTDRPTIVFTHHSPVTTLSQDNTLTQNIVNDGALREMFERHSNVVAIVSGHTPRPQYQNINGIHYFVGDTLVNEAGLGAFATIEARFFPLQKKASLAFEHYGKRRETYRGDVSLEKWVEEREWKSFKRSLLHLLSF